MFCPECKCEYLEGIKECVDCGVKLVETLPQEPKIKNDALVEIREYPGMGYGSIIRDILVESGIPVLLQTGSIYPTERIMVPKELAEKANKLIMEFDEAAAENESESDDEENENQEKNNWD